MKLNEACRTDNHRVPIISLKYGEPRIKRGSRWASPFRFHETGFADGEFLANTARRLGETCL